MVRASMSTSSNDQSGLAFYDENKKFISGLKYKTDGPSVLDYTEFVCPEKTAFIRLTMYKEEYQDLAKLWFMDGTVTTGRIHDGSAIRTAVIFFYLSNEGLSVLENAAVIGLPIPDKLKAMLIQLADEKKPPEDDDENDDTVDESDE